ncbi:copper transporter [Nocardioides sp. JQ2195]|uniref:copper transporter n=1 Tax=Nocardioides sp. JQ2195 TaxID=2592334 RepID=UPI00143EEAFF|nr:copper transporter [Nocardioides sp. JQ2195]QIX27526.1 copper transporter [Nocardioides sp. JQ2195]
MITFRYHVVSLVAVLVALAVGIALGGGPLSEIGRGDDATQSAEKDNARLSDDLEEAELVAGFQDQVTESLAASSSSAALKGQTVAMVTTPGVDPKLVSALVNQVKRSGGAMTGTFAMSQALLSSDGSSLVDNLGAQLVETTTDSGVDDAATTYARMGQLISRAISSSGPGGEPVDKGASNILSGLEAAELFSTSSGGTKRSNLVLVVLGDDLKGDGADKILGGLVTGLAQGSGGTVVAGDTDSATLAALRGHDEVTSVVSTVDSVQSGAGQLATVSALAAERSGEPGSYGAHGNDGAIPRG